MRETLATHFGPALTWSLGVAGGGVCGGERPAPDAQFINRTYQTLRRVKALPQIKYRRSRNNCYNIRGATLQHPIDVQPRVVARRHRHHHVHIRVAVEGDRAHEVGLGSSAVIPLQSVMVGYAVSVHQDRVGV